MKTMTSRNDDTTVLLIDGQCMLCNRITRFVVKRDKKKFFRFATLQSPFGQHLLRDGNLPLDDLDTFVMVQSKIYYTKSEAALRVLRRLDGWWWLLYPFILVPLAWRNLVYDRIARNRYRWFEKNDVCIMPTPDLINRFMDECNVHSKRSEGE
ncbi:thiol-disulfide oxidoreductase DCC family protein [Bacillus sp. FJAT-28004]|uniref:thiol-disulfide oxidoreductase DCC family protein n=1 Tax=Bacillus sp. FJAT-28004 TaxID=1679165 RepID=UPI0006B54500|nr:DCC1-like thiol-disulfide oxidoreductase family protein [Bacillus sp. FJAT-28004]